jgi:hypothetical protein
LSIVSSFRRLCEFSKMASRTSEISGEEIRVLYEDSGWYAENAQEMLRIATDAAKRLSHFFEIHWPSRTDCFVTDPETAVRIQRVTGAAYRSMVIIGIDEGHLSDFARIVPHELAHILSHEIGPYEGKLKGEGFACYANWVLDPKAIPCGLPLHYHLVWMLANGLDVSLEGLWERKDYTLEIYDLAWSFAAFCTEWYGVDGYRRLYSSHDASLRERVRGSLGVRIETLEKDWHELARGRVPASPRQIARMDRFAGALCSRAAWVEGNA